MMCSMMKYRSTSAHEASMSWLGPVSCVPFVAIECAPIERVWQMNPAPVQNRAHHPTLERLRTNW
jgi:hypothetical protein